jgi:hypothetical protein
MGGERGGARRWRRHAGASGAGVSCSGYDRRRAAWGEWTGVAAWVPLLMHTVGVLIGWLHLAECWIKPPGEHTSVSNSI